MGVKYDAQFQQRQLDRDRDYSGVRGYPSDREYMDTVRKATYEKQYNRGVQAAYDENARISKRSSKRGNKRPSRRK